MTGGRWKILASLVLVNTASQNAIAGSQVEFRGDVGLTREIIKFRDDAQIGEIAAEYAYISVLPPASPNYSSKLWITCKDYRFLGRTGGSLVFLVEERQSLSPSAANQSAEIWVNETYSKKITSSQEAEYLKTSACWFDFPDTKKVNYTIFVYDPKIFNIGSYSFQLLGLSGNRLKLKTLP